MLFIELSFENLVVESRRLAQLVKDSGFEPDAVAYLARGGWIIGAAVSEYLGCPLIELSAKRTGDSQKVLGSPFLSRLPRCVRHALRYLELKARLFRFEGTPTNREASITNRYELPKDVRSILLVDDSIDTGSSVMAGVACLHRVFPSAEIRTGVLNVITSSTSCFSSDWNLYSDALLCTPASKDSKEFGSFSQKYERGIL